MSSVRGTTASGDRGLADVALVEASTQHLGLRARPDPEVGQHGVALGEARAARGVALGAAPTRSGCDERARTIRRRPARGGHAPRRRVRPPARCSSAARIVAAMNRAVRRWRAVGPLLVGDVAQAWTPPQCQRPLEQLQRHGGQATVIGVLGAVDELRELVEVDLKMARRPRQGSIPCWTKKTASPFCRPGSRTWLR